MLKTENFEQVQVVSPEELYNWLLENHNQTKSVWVVTFKKHIPEKYDSTSDILDCLLCFGWIDGIRRKLDEDRTMQLISPRKVQHWTKSYKDRATKLQAEKKMQAPGLAAIEASKKSGLWTFMDDVDALIKPDDFIEALDALAEAHKNFDAFNPSSKRNMLRHIKLAKTEKTRIKRIKQLAELAEKNQKLPGS